MMSTRLNVIDHGPATDDASGDELESHGISSYSSSSSSSPSTRATQVFVLRVSNGESSPSEAASSDSQGSGDDGNHSLHSLPGLNASISEEQTHDGLEVLPEAQSEIQVQNEVQGEPQPQLQPYAEDERHPQAAEAQPHNPVQLQFSASARADDVQDTEVASGVTRPQEFSDAQDLSGHHPPPSTPANQSLTRIPIDFPVDSLVDSLQSQVRSQPQFEGEGERSWSQMAQAEEVSLVEEEISRFSFEATVAAVNASPHCTHASQFHPDDSQTQVDTTSSDIDTAQSQTDTSQSSFEARSYISRGTQGLYVQPNRNFVTTSAQDVSGMLQETGTTLPSAEDFVVVDRQASAALQHFQHQPLVQNHPRQGADLDTPEELPEHVDNLVQEHDEDMLQEEGARTFEDIDSGEHTDIPQEDPLLHSGILTTTPEAVADSSGIQNASLVSSAIGTSYPLSQPNAPSSLQHLDSADDVADSLLTGVAPSPPKTPEAFDDSVYNDVPGSY
ncbi:hypothetical protein BDQ12DRAFT_714699 [Crucibulum laeve]|uniref:Uncharacterized protein n=1 Tax=Crucibulum laeve TaxID=68775 RepID=A0A5C3LS98_9AGAR|nr:hypothetical protein BDQ12DRAFT_714699 [Crucibulum laeve]